MWDQVPFYKQELPLSCEAASARMAAEAAGIIVTEAQIRNLLPSSDNPDIGFVGSYYGSNGLPMETIQEHYGVHAGPIAEVLRKLGVVNAKAESLTDEQIRQALREGKVVIAWIAYAGEKRTPLTKSGPNGSVFVENEHAVVVIGTDGDRFWVRDPSGRCGEICSSRLPFRNLFQYRVVVVPLFNNMMTVDPIQIQ